MATDIGEEAKVNLRAALEALREWHKFQSSENANALYNAASKLFGSDFNPAEYDNVE